MENENFKNYTRSVAFTLILSTAQIKALARINKHETITTRCANNDENVVIISRQDECNTCVRLEKKGLITHDGDKFITTRAGQYVVGLLLISFDEDELYTNKKINSKFRYTEEEKN